MYDETTDSFVWLFETFLQAMSGKAPKTIITNQDAAMAKAISQVMPNTYHKLCMWHMMQNALKHIRSVFNGFNGVKSVLPNLIDKIEEEYDFFTTWNNMLDEYDMHTNDWLSSIFKLKEKWAFTYVRHVWSAGMKSTQLSKSFHASLKDYLKSDHNVSQFFMHFERVLKDMRYKELEAKYESCFRLVNTKISVKILIQAREVYTKKIFEDFQDQFEDAVDLSIPNEYIFKRWTKQARFKSVQDINGREIQADPKLQQTCRYRSMCSIFTRISNRASESEKADNLTYLHASNLAKLVENILQLEREGDKEKEYELSPP